jgi:hypothetical protein
MKPGWRRGLSAPANFIAKTLLLSIWISGLPALNLAGASVPEITRPQDFDPIFSQGVVIVGGHAVNLWASYYADRNDPVLAGFAPFTSKDADIYLQDRDLATAIATAAGWRFRSNPEPRSPILGSIVMKRGETELQVEVLRSVTGLSAEELSATEAVIFANRKSYSVSAN